MSRSKCNVNAIDTCHSFSPFPLTTLIVQGHFFVLFHESGEQFSSFCGIFFAQNTCFWLCAVLIYRVLLANFNSITIDFATLEVWTLFLAFHLQGCCAVSIRARLLCHVVLPSAPVPISIISGAALYALRRIVHSDSTLIPLLSFHFPLFSPLCSLRGR